MSDERFFEQDALYELDLISHNLRRLNNGDVYLNRQTSAFVEIADIFKKVEPKESINVIRKQNDEEVIV